MDARWLPGAVVVLAVAAPAAATETEDPGPEFTVVSLPGTPVEPSTDTRAPTPLDAGIWRDTLGGGDNSAHFYVYRRTVADSTVHLGVVSSATESYDTVDVEVTAPEADDVECGSDDDGAPYATPYAVFGSAVSIGPDSLGDRNAECLKAGELRIKVSRTGSSGQNDLPIAIRVVEEAPDKGTGVPDAVETAKVPQPEVAEAGTTTGATALDEAPYLDDGEYGTTVAEGEQRLWRVRLDWGQQLSVVAVLAKQPADLPEQIGFVTPDVNLTLLDPRFAATRGTVEGNDTSAYYGPDEQGLLIDGTAPVNLNNRFAGLPAFVPGDYWIGIAVPPADEREPLEVPVTLSVQVVGDPEGVPPRPAGVLGQGGTAAPEGYTPETPFLVGKDQWSADISGAPAAPGEESTASSDDDGTRRVAGLVVGAASLLSCAAGVLLLARRRVSRPAAR